MASYSDLKKRVNQYGVSSNEGKSGYEKLKEKLKNNGSAINGVDEKYVNSFIHDSNDFFNSVQSEYEGIGWGNSLSAYESRQSSWKDLNSRADNVRAWLNNNKSRLDEKNYEELMGMLDTIGSHGSKVVSSFADKNNFYRQFETEDAYNKWKSYEDERQTVIGAEDFADNSKYQSTRNDTEEIKDRWIGGYHFSGSKASDLYDDVAYEYINKNQDVIDRVNTPTGGDPLVAGSGTLALINRIVQEGNSTYEGKGLDFLTDEEIGIYNYYYHTEGKEKADEFLVSLTESLKYRKAYDTYESLDSDFQKYLFGAYAGFSQFVSGVANLGYMITGDEAPISSTQIASGLVREDLDGFAQVGYDLINTSANMLPSILVGTLTGNVGGLVTMGASVAGNAYAEMRNLGYTANQARLYSGLVTAAELGLQSVLGGYKKLGGKLSNGITEFFASKVDNAIAKFAIRHAGSMLSEGVEEALQSILEPTFKSFISGDKYDVDWSEVIYSGLLGALSAGVMEAPSTAVGAIQGVRNDIAASKIYGESAQDLVNETLEVAPEGSEAVLLADKYQQKLDKGKKLSGGQLNHLVDVNEQLLRDSDTAKMKSSVENRLTQLGENGNVSTLAEVIVKAASGENLTLHEEKILNDSRYGQRVFNEMSPENIETGGYTSAWAKSIGTERINREAYNGELNPQAKAVSGAKNAQEALSQGEYPIHTESSQKTGEESVYKQSYDGKTYVKDKNGDYHEASNIEISSIKNGEVFVRTEDGNEVNAKDVSFGNAGDALMIEMVANLGVGTETAKAMMATYNKGKGIVSPEVFRADAPLAYKYGRIEYTKGLANLDLTQDQKVELFGMGRTDAKAEVEAKQTALNKKKATVSNTEKVGKKSGKITYLDGAKPKGNRQKSAVKLIEVLSESIGNNWYVFSSYVENGKRVYKDVDGKVKPAPNGKYDTATGDIYIDLNAGQKGEGLMVFTMAHELTHFIRQWSPAKFKVFADFLVEQYGEKGVSVEKLIQRKITNAKEKGRELSYDAAYEEVIADSCETMLRDSNAIEAIAKLKAKDKTVWEKIKDFISRLVEKIRAAYAKLNPDSVEANHVLKMKDAAEKLQALWTDALVDAGESFKSVNGMVQIDADSESVSPLFSERTWTESEYVQAREDTAEKLAKALGVSKKKALAYIDDVNSIAKMIADNRVRLDYEASPFGSAFVSNSEYGGSFDFTTLCKKRRLYTGTFSEIQKRLKDVALTPDDILKIRNMMIERSEEATCGLCYVEGSRANMGKFSKEFIRLYKRDNPNAWIPNMADVNTPDGVESMKINHPEAYEQYEYFWNHYGKLKDSDPALFASQQKPKLYEARKEYKGEILKNFKNDSTVEKKNLNGGIRMQSFSDFEIVHMIDTMQIIMDMASVGLAGQAYTKVIEFAESFGNTGLKINLSLIAKGVDENGNLIFDDREGMAHSEAFRLRDKYSANVGTIIVTFTDEQLLAAMADPRIDFIIPFHRSQWKKDQYGAMGLPKGTKDYTFMQNEKLIKQTYHEYRGKLVKDKASNYMPNEYWDFSKSGKENAEAYLKMCAENNKRPKFYKLLDYDGKGAYSLKKDGSTDGYWKLLIDFKMYDNNGVGSPQNAVTPNFSMNEATHILDEYRGGHQSYPVANDVVDAFVSDYQKDNNVKYSDRDFASQVDDVLNGADTSSTHLKLMDTPKLLQEAGLPNLPVLMTAKHLKTITSESGHGKVNYHGLSVDVVKNLPKYISDPVMIADSFTRNDSVVIITEAIDSENRPVIAAILLNGTGRLDGEHINANIMTSAYGRNNFQAFINRIADENAVIYWDKKKSQDLSVSLGIQFPNAVTSLNSNTIIRKAKAFVKGNSKNSENSQKFSDRDLAPTFYSQMGKVVDGMKQDKFAANSVVSMLRGRGVKAEEIRWSGIATYLEGKKSVTKQELMEFIQGSQLQIGEQDSSAMDTGIKLIPDQNTGDLLLYIDGALEDTFFENKNGEIESRETDELFANKQQLIDAYESDYGRKRTRWSQYKLKGGENYREIVFTMPNASYTNNAMWNHWGEDAEGVLAHARIQDFDVNGKKMLFIEELQSDWHNEGAKKGYADSEAEEKADELRAKREEAFFKLEDYSTELTGLAGEWASVAKTDKGAKLLAEYNDASAKYKKASDVIIHGVPDAPFRNTYHEYVLKRLLRMAAEQGYDSIGWTPADVQSKRWSDEFAEGYRIEYDQDIPKFLKKYGRQWGAKVEKTILSDDANRNKLIAELEFEVKELEAELVGTYGADLSVGRSVVANMKEEIANLRKKDGGTEVWSMDITDSMKDSVLHEGQVLYSDRVTDKETLDFLENQEHVTVYRAMQLIDGKLYPPMNAYTYDKDGKKVLVTPSEVGVWEQSVERPDLIDPKTGKFKLDKGKVDGGKRGTIVPAAYNPYIHTSLSMLNDQFTSAYTRSNLVVVKGVVPKSELTSGYKAQFAKDSVGETEWHSGVVSTQLPESRKVILSRWFKPVEVMDNDVVAQNIKEMLGDTGIEIPYNVVSPKLRRSLEKIGVPIGEGRGIRNLPSKDEVKYSDRDPDSVSNRSLLANALESAAQNDIEKNKLAQYKAKIELIESEEAKLHELRGQIKEISFARGRRDIDKLKSLQFEAHQAANRINTYDRQLLALEASKPLKDVLEREKQLAYKKAERKGKDALAAYREKTAKTTRELMTRYQESRAKATEGRHKTELRHKIKDVVSKLNQLLLRPTKDKHVKEELRTAVAEALSAINMDTIGADERVAKFNKLIANTNDPDMIAELTKTRDRIELQGDNLKDKLTALQKAYEKVKNSTDSDLKNAYQEPVMNAIKNVGDLVGSTSIRDMSLTQLEAVYEMYTMVLHTVRTANKAFKAQKGETITQIAEAVNDEVRKISKEKFARTKFAKAVRKIQWTLLKPFTAFRTIGSDTFTGMLTELRNGEDTYYADINEAKAFIQDKYKKYNFKAWDQKQTKTFKAKSGKEFTLNLEQMMSLYAYSRREQAHDHIIEGGIVLKDNVIEKKNKIGITTKYEVDTTTAFNISEETLEEICNSLTKEQKAFVEDMQAYLSDVMGEKGNEVSMELLGIKLFREKFYFPIKSSKDYMDFKPQEAGEIKLKNASMTKETVQHANNPIVLNGFTDVWANHIHDMSMYHAFVLALEDFTRVYNYKTKTAANLETMSTKETIANAYGDGATKYISNFLTSLNGGVRVQNLGIPSKFMSRFKKGAVLASASVAIQQPSAIMRAMAMVNPIHFVTSTHKSINLVKHKQDWAELKQYAPIAGIKEMGRFDVGMGQDTVKWIKDQNTFMENVDELLSKAPAFMDEVTWVGIWNAVKNEVKHQNKGLKVDSEEFLKKCGERFTEVISLTQVYDSVFSRSDIMRNDSEFAKMLTAFMAEPTTTMNMVWDSFVQGKRTGSVKGFIGKTAGTTGAIIGSIVLNSALKSIITAMRDDDDDESYAEKYLGAFVGTTLDNLNPLTYIPFVKDIWSIFQGYDVVRMDMDLFADLYKAIDAMDSESKTDYEKWTGLIGAIVALVGVPFKNVERDIRGAYNTIMSFLNGEKTTEAGLENALKEALTGKDISNAQQLYDAIIRGDQEQIDRVKGRFEDQDAIDSAMKKALRENDSRIREAAQARMDGDIAEYKRIAKEIIAEGNFSQDIVVGAINAEINAIKRDEVEGTAEDSSDAQENEVTSIYKASDINDAFESGDTDLAKEIIQDLINTKVANGMEEKNAKSSVRSSMTSYWKSLYQEAYKNKDNAEMARIRKILYNSGLYGNTTEVINTTKSWLKDG